MRKRKFTKAELDKRFVFKDIPLTRKQRAQMKAEKIAEAKAWIPPKTKTRLEEVEPDDPRYENAPVAENWIMIP